MPLIMLPATIFWGWWITRRISLANFGLLFVAGSIGAFFLQPFSVGSVVAIAGIITIIATTQPHRSMRLPSPPRPSMNLDEVITSSAALLCSGSIIALAILNRSGEALRSPWQIATPAWFVLFFLGCIATFKLSLNKSPLASPALALLGFTCTSVALIIFANGFGFDPFLHRGAVQALMSAGHLEPIRLLYSGYYGLIATLSTLLAVPLKIVDLLLIPVVASLFPMMLYRSLIKTIDAKRATFAAFGFLLAPYAFFTFSIPFSVTTICTIGSVAFMHIWQNDSRRQAQFLTLNVLAVFFHPLIAVPTILWMATAIISNRILHRRTTYFIGTLLIALSIPAMLALNNVQSGITPFSMAWPWQNINVFFALFRDPFQIVLMPAPAWLDLLYSYKLWTVPVIGILAMVTPILRKAHRQQGIAQLPLFIGLFLGTLLIATNLRFNDVIWYEQQEFCFRILHVLWLLPLPLAMQTLSTFVHRKQNLLGAIGILLSFQATVSWYFSYQQYNEKNLTSGPAVSSADYAALEKIYSITGSSSYLVLANQMLSAAAIEQYGFDQTIIFDGQQILRYPIPTGGTLYPFFLQMNDYPQRELAQNIAERGNVENIIFVVHDYWPFAKDIVSFAENLADETIEIHQGAVTLLVYRFPKESNFSVLQ